MSTTKDKTAEPTKKEVELNPAALKAVDNLLAKYDGPTDLIRFGEGVEIPAEATLPEPKYWIPTGVVPFDCILGGGFPTGRISEIHGLEGSYKTGFGAQTLLCNLLMGGVSMLDDNEQSYDPNKYSLTDWQTFIYSQQNVLEKYYESLISRLDCIKTYNVSTAVVWDSIPATKTSSELKSNIGDQTFEGARAANIHGIAILKIFDLMVKSNCALIMINQLRDNHDSLMDPYYTPGGNALRYYQTIRIRLMPRGGKFSWVNDSKQVDGFFVRAEVVKNKLSAPFKTASIPILFGNNVGGCPAMSMFQWLSETKGFASTALGRYSIEGIEGVSLKKDFQKFYLNNIEKFLDMFKQRTGFEYRPEARQAVIKYTRHVYRHLA